MTAIDLRCDRDTWHQYSSLAYC